MRISVVMILVIDGYNVLKNVLHPNYVTDSHRKQFINQLGRYGKKKGHKMVLVFDGGPWERPDQDLVDGVYVVYSGVNQTADHYIKDYLQRYKAYDILLVSTDRELGRYASRLNMHSIDSIDFYELLRHEIADENEPKQSQQLIKTVQVDRAQVDALMAEGSKVVPHKSEEEPLARKRKSPSRRPSKKERSAVEKIKKL
jgi:hypothetical protein